MCFGFCCLSELDHEMMSRITVFIPCRFVIYEFTWGCRFSCRRAFCRHWSGLTLCWRGRTVSRRGRWTSLGRGWDFCF